MRPALVAVTFFVSWCVVHSAPAEIKDEKKEPKPIFIDEIVVESSLTVRRKNKPNERQSRNQNITTIPLSGNTQLEKIKVKREITLPTGRVVKRQTNHHRKPQNQFQKPPPFGASAANSQSQAFNSFSPIGSFGASSTGAQTQSFGATPNDLFGSGGFSGTQQYNFNGQTVDIAFGNAFSGADGGNAKAGGATITITGPDGRKRPFNG